MHSSHSSQSSLLSDALYTPVPRMEPEGRRHFSLKAPRASLRLKISKMGRPGSVKSLPSSTSSNHGSSNPSVEFIKTPEGLGIDDFDEDEDDIEEDMLDDDDEIDLRWDLLRSDGTPKRARGSVGSPTPDIGPPKTTVVSFLEPGETPADRLERLRRPPGASLASAASKPLGPPLLPPPTTGLPSIPKMQPPRFQPKERQRAPVPVFSSLPGAATPASASPPGSAGASPSAAGVSFAASDRAAHAATSASMLSSSLGPAAGFAVASISPLRPRSASTSAAALGAARALASATGSHSGSNPTSSPSHTTTPHASSVSAPTSPGSAELLRVQAELEAMTIQLEKTQGQLVKRTVQLLDARKRSTAPVRASLGVAAGLASPAPSSCASGSENGEAGLEAEWASTLDELSGLRRRNTELEDRVRAAESEASRWEESCRVALADCARAESRALAAESSAIPEFGMSSDASLRTFNSSSSLGLPSASLGDVSSSSTTPQGHTRAASLWEKRYRKATEARDRLAAELMREKDARQTAEWALKDAERRAAHPQQPSYQAHHHSSPFGSKNPSVDMSRSFSPSLSVSYGGGGGGGAGHSRPPTRSRDYVLTTPSDDQDHKARHPRVRDSWSLA